MAHPLHLLLLLFAFVCFCSAAISMPSGKVNLIAAGLAFWVAASIF